MDFETVLDGAIELLRRRGRVTFGALKRQYDLTDDYVEDLVGEIVDGQQIARVEGKVLVLIDDAPAPDESPPPADGPARDAENRQITVEFCDLVGSTELSSSLDPETYHEVISSYQAACRAVIEAYDGHVAQYLGDGVLIYCGYPTAHEDDAHRAIRIGTGIVAAMHTLNERIEPAHGVRLGVRVGIHTGPVVVGQLGSSDRQENLALGATPNIAARLQSIAEPNTVVISETTRRVIGDAFELEALGDQNLSGIAEPVPAFVVGDERVGASRFETRGHEAVSIVARDEELALVLRRWEQAIDSEGQVVLLAGEPGIGKSRIVQAVLDRLAETESIRHQFQCSAYETNTVLHPFVAALAREARLSRDDDDSTRFTKLTEFVRARGDASDDDVRLLAQLLSISTGDEHPPLAMSPQLQRERTIGALCARSMAGDRDLPVALVLEDLHWSDPTTLEAIEQLIDSVHDRRVLLVLTYRPGEFDPPPHWHERPHLSVHSLNRLGRRQVATLVGRVAGQDVADDVVEHIADKTDGVPLFVEELIRSMLESGALVEREGVFVRDGSVSSVPIPATLQDTLTARLDRLGPVKELAQAGAALGREFGTDVVREVSRLTPQEFDEGIDALVRSGLVFRRGGTCRFKHALIQDTAYDSMVRTTRSALHSRIADALHSSGVASDRPEEVARHFSAADRPHDAIPHWLSAGQKASRASAMAEALAHLGKGLDLAQRLPETDDRTRHEYALRTELGLTHISQMGWQADPVAEHLREASRHGAELGEVESLLTVHYGMFIHFLNRGDFESSTEWLGTLRADAERHPDSDALIVADAADLIQSWFLGRYEDVMALRDRIVAAYDLGRHGHFVYVFGNDLKVLAHGFCSSAEWICGRLDDAERSRQLAEEQTRIVGHPFDLAWQLTVGSWTLFFNGDVERWTPRVDEIAALGDAQGIPFIQLIFGPVWTGFVQSMTGAYEEAAANLGQGLGIWESMGGGVATPMWHSQLGHVLCALGQMEAGLEQIDEAIGWADRGERWYEPEVHRIKGHWLERSDATAAEASYLRAIESARELGAASWELKASASLATLWAGRDRSTEARELLAPILARFEQGLDLPVVRDARELLDRL